MMTQNEFVDLVNGKPWINRHYDFDGMDCYGLVMLYYKHVLEINLPVPQGYLENGKMSDCWNNEISSGRWETIQRPIESALVFTAYHGKLPMHVGVMLNRMKVIHCRGDITEPGKVEVHTIRAIQKYYGNVTFQKYVGE